MLIIWIVLGAIVAIFLLTVAVGAPYVPSLRRDIAWAFDELYPIDADDLLVDIGSGDGVVCRAASRRGARVIGYEINPVLVAIARFLSRNDPKVSYRLANMWQIKLPEETTVVYLFAVGRDIGKLAKRLQRHADVHQRSLHVISYGFMIDGWQPVKREQAYTLYEVVPLQPEKA